MPKRILANIDIEAFKAFYPANGQAASMEKFGMSKSTCRDWVKQLGLSVDKEVTRKLRAAAMTGRTSSTPKIDEILKENYLTIPEKRLAKYIKRSDCFVCIRLRQLGLVIPPEIIAQRKIDSQIKKGSKPLNKGKKWDDFMSKEAQERSRTTTFKKGHLPKNTLRDKVITIRYDHKNRGGAAYKYIRISLGKWMPLHKYYWEEKHGPIPAGHCLWFKDGNSLNCDLSNLELITRGENLARNSVDRLAGNVKDHKETRRERKKRAKHFLTQELKLQAAARKAAIKREQLRAPKTKTAAELARAEKSATKAAQRINRERSWANNFMQDGKPIIRVQTATKALRIDERTVIFIEENEDPTKAKADYIKQLELKESAQYGR